MSNNKSDGLLGGMIIGAALGAIAGILAAPRTGKETRHILKKSADALPELAEDLATSIQFHADRLSDTSLANWEQTLGRLREAVAAGRSASQQEWVRQSQIQQPLANHSSSSHPSSGHSTANSSASETSGAYADVAAMSESAGGDSIGAESQNDQRNHLSNG